MGKIKPDAETREVKERSGGSGAWRRRVSNPALPDLSAQNVFTNPTDMLGGLSRKDSKWRRLPRFNWGLPLVFMVPVLLGLPPSMEAGSESESPHGAWCKGVMILSQGGQEHGHL